MHSFLNIVLSIPFAFSMMVVSVPAQISAAQTSSSAQAVDERVETLLEEMTLEEKIGQMTQVTLGVVTPSGAAEVGPAESHPLDPVEVREALVEHHVGSILNVANQALTVQQWRDLITRLQDVATEETRLGLPIIYGIDAVHGANYLVGATIFPHNIGLAATFNRRLARRVGHITAQETRASGIPWNFAPVLDIGRQPQWPRFYETFGEDVLVTRVMGAALVEGMQGEDLREPDRVAATMKHFVGYSGPESGRDRTTAQIPERLLRSHYLPPFQAAIDAGAATIMVNSGDVNGVPVHASKHLLTGVLREEMGFDGLVVSDWRDILKLHDVHRVAESTKEATRMALEAGIDMSMVPYDFSFYDDALALVREGTITEERIDASVRRILRLKMKLGLLDDAYPPEGEPQINTPAFQEANLRAARQSLTLLKNEGDLLPLSEDAQVLVTGPASDSEQALLGGWSYTWQGDNAAKLSEEDLSVLEAVRQQHGAENVSYVAGGTFEKAGDVAAAVEAAEEADVVVLAVGENAYAETPGNLLELDLPNAQRALASALAETGTPLVLVVVEGRPRLMPEVFEASDAALMAYLPGAQGGRAIAEVLFGAYSPSGRLPFSYPEYPGDFTTYDRLVTSGLGPNQQEIAHTPQFPFGHGLSYTTFAYEDLRLSTDALGEGETLTATVEVTNTGEHASGHVALLFVADLYASVVPRERQLKGFQRIHLEPGETKTVAFELAADDLAIIDRHQERVTEPGTFRLTVGGLQSTFEYTGE